MGVGLGLGHCFARMGAPGWGHDAGLPAWRSSLWGGPGLSWAPVTYQSACEPGPEAWVGPGLGRERVRPQLVLGYPRLGGQSFGIKRESYRAVRDIVRYFAW